MEKADALITFVVLAGIVVFSAILFGPSLYSSYQNWKIKRGLKR
ncbi:MAG: hypothetical protein ACLP5H_33130 [Desulfomonilaceae bacterium]